MKIQGPSGPQQTSKTSKTGKKEKAGNASFEGFVSSGPQEAASSGPSQSIAQVDVLLAAQAVEDPTERAARQRMRRRGGDLLDALDQIRMALLGGNLTVGHVIDIADVVAAHREKIADTALTAILDEIDLRAQIELAKMRKALDDSVPK